MHLRVAAIALVALALPGAAAVGQTGPRVRVTFQPDCYRASLSAACDPRKVNDRLDMGPQIAVWIETAGGQFVDTVMVTNLTAQLGLGNRPGHVSMPSGPKFPYGRRPMVLPVWAHKRNKLYDSVVMQDGLDKEYWLGFHEVVSSPDPYYCRPMTLKEIDVDAVTCPTQTFNSVKGRFFDPRTDVAPDGSPRPGAPPAQSYYPPRNDLRNWIEQDCDRTSDRGPNCPTSSKRYEEINDLDSVAAATPAYGGPFSRSWRVPDNLPDGDYAVLVEVSKEFDNNPSHSHPAVQDPMLREWGLTGNFGQPSVVFRVPFKLDRQQADQQATDQIAGTETGMARPARCTRPTAPSATPGIGRGPPAEHQPAGRGRWNDPGPGARVDRDRRRGAARAAAADAGAGPGDAPVSTAVARTRPSRRCPQLPGSAGHGDRRDGGDGGGRGGAGHLRRADGRRLGAGGELRDPALERRRSDRRRVRRRTAAAGAGQVGAGGHPDGGPAEPEVQEPVHRGRARARRMPAAPAGLHQLQHAVRQFTQLSGCFIATAAYGSPMASDVQTLRRVRDGLRARSPLAAAAADVYARSSPPLADALRASEAARAVTRALLAPLVTLAK
jgi:hypothetical protein